MKGAQISTKESHLYGRWEAMCKPATGSGIISSFFLFSDTPDYKTNWQEVDWEFLGKNTNSIQSNLIRTTNYGKKSNSEVSYTLPKRSSDEYWKLCIEWFPKAVVWKINDTPFRTEFIEINKPMKLMMNIWSGLPSWSGILHEGLLPQQAEYSYLRYTPYIKGKFVGEKAVQYEFNTLDLNVFQIATHKLGDTQLVKENVSVSNGNLILKLNA